MLRCVGVNNSSFYHHQRIIIIILLLFAISFTECQNQQQAGAPPALPGLFPPGNDVRKTPGPGYREWRTPGDPTLLQNLWKSRTPLGNAELYIILALLIGLGTVIIGCWLSDNCWSPEPEHRRFVSSA